MLKFTLKYPTFVPTRFGPLEHLQGAYTEPG